jgi:hypothetical protein
MQVLGLASIVAVLAVAGVSAASTLRNRGTSEATSEGTVVADAPPSKPAKSPSKTPAPKAEPVVQQSAPARSQAPETTTAAAAVNPPTPAPVSTPAPAIETPLRHGGFAVSEGRTQIADSIVAIRTGDSVIVNFDAYGFRTRRSDKIENTFRMTLPMILGKMATSGLDTVANGALVTNRDVIGSLATEGMRFTLANGSVVRLRVLTRPVTDGPIAIGYLATFER